MLALLQSVSGFHQTAAAAKSLKLIVAEMRSGLSQSGEILRLNFLYIRRSRHHNQQHDNLNKQAEQTATGRVIVTSLPPRRWRLLLNAQPCIAAIPQQRYRHSLRFAQCAKSIERLVT